MNTRSAALGTLIAGALCAPMSIAQQSGSDALENESLPYVVAAGKVDRSTYLGWRVFHSTCYVCHGVDAEGTSVAPDLTEKVAALSPEDFTLAVLYRYPIIVGFSEASGDDLTALREAFIEEVRKHERGDLLMPTWDRDPNVKPHVLDLYAYLRARADGVLGNGRPEQLSE